MTKEPVKKNPPYVWKYIEEGNIIDYEGVLYEVAFKTVRKRRIEYSIIIESQQILYLRPFGNYTNENENVMAEIDKDGDLIFMWDLNLKNIGTNNAPFTGIGYESWTEDYLNSLKQELARKIALRKEEKSK